MVTYMPMITATVALAVGISAVMVIANRLGSRFYSRFERVRRALPEFNCGACGFSECIDYAVAVAKGVADPLACIPGGPGTAHAIADILGTTASVGEPVMAVVHCGGGSTKAKRRSRYEGIPDCHAALLFGSGFTECTEGCLGLGSCVRVCPFGAISITPDELATVDRHKCTGCGTCVSSCPRNLISLIPHVHKIYLSCNNHDHGEQVAAYCSVGCTACGECVAITPSGAVTMQGNLPLLDYNTPGENFIAAAYRCPQKCFVDLVKVRPKANIDTKCDGCAECSVVCPVTGAITGRKGIRHVVKKELCIGCGRCLAICHVRAISLWGSLGYATNYKGGT
jgi:Na+-translocating ferredoxin:NAD+ oxidoreductase subunit B